ncbi:SRPBCC family protein [Azonexus hydrophilus]|uniref:SRPBCC family protein n=1 Tax=Azonexus hydrophilus TaxID=418702 RepID=UPI0024924B29|nr:SRPBCC family protein [Azonexus hydrophilus]
MNFEHLIAINDPGNPLVMQLTRRQLWLGLLHRVDNPLLFLPGLADFTMLERQADSALRELDFGAARIRDRVTLTEEQVVRFDIEPSAEQPGGSLTIRIEEPNDGHLFLRFSYVTGLAIEAGSEEAAYIEYVKSAYHQSDLDCVRIIRTLAAEGTCQ